ncbi:MAG TPA: hypothetical protein VGO60_10815 [Iamia sp.]|jgi:hypothetical protein|nr:hypothetical protein [Iamia sp.]
MIVHPAIRTASAVRLGAPPAPDGDDAPPASGAATRAKALVRRAGGAVLDRVGNRAAAATAGQVDQLRDELDRTRTELQAEIELLRAELAAQSRT